MDSVAVHTIDETRRREFAWLGIRSPSIMLTGLVCLYVALVPSVQVLPTAEIFDGQRLLEVFVLLAAGVLVACSDRLRGSWLDVFCSLPAIARWGFVLIASLGFLSAGMAAVPRLGLLELSHIALLFCLAAIVAHARRESPEQTDQVLISAVGLNAFFYAVSFSISYAAHLAGALPLWPGSFTGFSSVRFFNQFQTWTLPLMVLPAAFLPQRMTLLRRLFQGIAVLWWTLLFASGGRGTLLGMGIAVLFTLLAFRKRALSWLRLQALTFGCGAVLFWLLFKVIAVTGSSILDRDISRDGGRYVMLADAWEMVRADPLLGAGPLHYAYYPTGNFAAHPHNAVAQWAAEWGAPSLLILLALTAWGMFSWLRHCKKEMDAGQELEHAMVRVAVTAALVAAAVQAVFDGTIVMPMSQVMMVLTMGWAWGMYVPEGVAAEVPTRRSRLMLGAVVATFVCGVMWGVSGDVFVLEKRQADFWEWSPDKSLRPRYWQQGFFGYDGY